MNIKEIFKYLENGLATVIDLEEEEVINEIDETGILYLAELLRFNPNVEAIKFRYINISYTAFVSLFKSLAHLEKLNELNIQECNWDCLTVKSLDNFVNKVSVIDFSRNNLTGSGDSLANLIKYQINLRELWLSDCNLSDNDIELIAEA